MSRDLEKKKANWRKWYNENKAKAKEYRDAKQQRLIQWFQNYKKTLSCKHCGNNDFRVLCFHHLDPTIKDKDISNIALRGTKTQILRELEKCICLCMNCHTIVHFLGHDN